MVARRLIVFGVVLFVVATASGCTGWFGARPEGLVLLSPQRPAPPAWVNRPPAPTKDVLYFVGIAEQSRQESLARNVAFADAVGQIALALRADVTEAIRLVAQELPDLAGGIDLNALQSEVTDVFAAGRITGARQEDVYLERYGFYRGGQLQYPVYKVYTLVAFDRQAYERELREGLEQLKKQAQAERRAELERLYDEVMLRRALQKP